MQEASNSYSLGEFGLLNTSDLNHILDGRQKSNLAGFVVGQAFGPRIGWVPGALSVFNDGSGVVYFDFRTNTYTTSEKSASDSFFRDQYWQSGSATNAVHDPTPLIVGIADMPIEKAMRYVPRNTPVLQSCEMMLVFESFSNDYDSDGHNSWVSGASHKPGTAFIGKVPANCAAILRQRCSGRAGR